MSFKPYTWLSAGIFLLTSACSGLAKRADRQGEHSFLTAWHKIWATITFRIRSLPLVPGKTIALLVEEKLGLSFDFDHIPIPNTKDARRRLFHPPTKRQSLLISCKAHGSMAY